MSSPPGNVTSHSAGTRSHSPVHSLQLPQIFRKACAVNLPCYVMCLKGCTLCCSLLPSCLLRVEGDSPIFREPTLCIRLQYGITITIKIYVVCHCMTRVTLFPDSNSIFFTTFRGLLTISSSLCRLRVLPCPKANAKCSRFCVTPHFQVWMI